MVETQWGEAPVTSVHAAHRRFVEAVSELTQDELTAPTALPGWTRAHVIAHVADGGRAFADLTEAALRGELVALFPGGVEERNDLIEKLAASPDLMSHLETGITRLETLWEGTKPEDWARPVRFRNGDLAGTVFARWREVWIHLVDCEVGVTPADWPTELAAHTVDFLLSRVPENTTLIATDTDQRWGPPDGVRLSGPVRDLAAWTAGREPAHPLNGPPIELGEWPPHPTPTH